ncbi:MAG: alanine racemase [Arsenophonus sp.]|nr:MAG: alanine racemase [Arsenophonus sp.]
MENIIAIINKSAIRHNLKFIKKKTKKKIMTIVKSNAYGHGLLKTSKIIQDLTDYFGVAKIKEAILLKKSGIYKPILILSGFIKEKELKIITKYNFHTVIHHIEQLNILKKTDIKKKINIWMKIDTGMHRLGIRMEESEIFYKKLIQCTNVQNPINIISHFSQADNFLKSSTQTKKELNNFFYFIKKKSGLKSIASSSSILLYPKSYLNLIRPGIITYGISPIKNKIGKNFGLKSVMKLKSFLISIKKHKYGESVGYHGLWISKKNTYIGIISIGYGDGYPQSVPFGTPVLIGGKRVPIIGKISMNMITVDLGINHNFYIGQEVIIWGSSSLPIEKIEKYTGISSYSLLTQLNNRIAFKYVK